MGAILQVLKIILSFVKFDLKPQEKAQAEKLGPPLALPVLVPPVQEHPTMVIRVPSAEILKQGWSKNLADCCDKLKDAYPKVQAAFLAKHMDLGMRCDYTWRSGDFQHELFMKGRSMVDGKAVITDPKLVVTQVDGGKSHHNPYPSQALDFILFKGKVPIWVCKEHPEYAQLYAEVGRLFESHGLIAGATWKYNWKDPGHVQVAYTIV